MIDRVLAEKIQLLAAQFPVVSITGPRQSGKTTLVRELFADYRYVNLEHPDQRFVARESPMDLLNHRGKGLIVDEAQYVPELFSHIQLVVDERNTSGEFILTGSQHFLLMERVSQSLAGRVAVLNLLPFSMQELEPTPFRRTTALSYILNGFYPRIYDKGIAPTDFFPNYIQTYIERDVRQIINVSDLDVFQTFVRLCAGRTGQLFSQSEVGKLAGVDQKTVSRWLSILKTGFQVFSLSPYFENFNKRIVKTPKLYFYDTGVACSLLGIRSEDDLQLHFARGALFENLIITEILKSFLNQGIRPDMYFWRDHAGHEIDLLIDHGGRLYPIEIKASQTFGSDDLKGLHYFNEIAKGRVGEAYLIYGGEQNATISGIQVRSWTHLPDFSRV